MNGEYDWFEEPVYVVVSNNTSTVFGPFETEETAIEWAKGMFQGIDSFFIRLVQSPSSAKA